MDRKGGIGQEDYPLISIIVPIFNAEQTLCRCVDSILSQTYRNLEIILVDDGSTDRSGELCDRYAKQDSRVKVVHEKNGGVVKARRTGVSVAKGFYVGFVDSDDNIDEDTYHKMYHMSENGTVDMVGCGCVVEGTSKSSHSLNRALSGIYEEDRIKSLKCCMMFDEKKGAPAVFQSVCSKIFRRELLLDIVTSIDDRITVGEDAAVVYPFLLKASKIVLSDICCYHYMINGSSMTRSKDHTIFERIYLFQSYMSACFKEYDEKYKLDIQLKWYLLHLIDMGTANLYGIRHKRIRRLQLDQQLNGKRVIIYGAGKVGKEYYLQILKMEDIRIIAWVDKNLAGKEIYHREIQKPEMIKSMEFDYVLLAIADVKVAEEIKEEIRPFCSQDQIIYPSSSIRYSGEIEFVHEY